jgi:4-amino-4-deoxy-L-arabinose transferase-like glycosyltransferase
MNLKLDREAKQRVIVAVVALLTFLAVTLFIWRSQGLVANFPDPYSFLEMGRSVARGNGFAGYGEVLGRRAPLYPAFVGAIYWVFGEKELFVQVAQGLLFIATCSLAYDMGRRIYNPRTGLIAGLACALHPSFLRYVADFHLETLATFTFTLAVWFSVRFWEKPTLPRGAAFGFGLGLASLTKAVFLLYPAVFAAVWLWTQRERFLDKRAEGPWLKPLLGVGLIFVAMGLTISPWTIRNYHTTGGKIVPIGTGLSDAFLRGYVFSRWEFATLSKPPYTDAENEVNAAFKALCAEKGIVWEKNDLETDRCLAEEAKKKLVAEPLEFVRKFAVGLFTFWYEMTSMKTSLVAGLSALGAWILAGLGMRRGHREGHPFWLLLAPVLYLNVLLAALLALGRYSVPVLPCLLVMAAFGADTVLERFGKKTGTAPRREAPV